VIQEEKFATPVVVVSRCLGFDACRHDGAILPDKFLAKMADHVEFVDVCPEVAIGLGTPRDPIRIVEQEGRRRLVQPSTGADLTERMNEFSASFLSGLREPDGFVLKNRSPSCAISDTKIYASAETKQAPLGRGPGLFAGAVLERFGDVPVIDEGRLSNFTIREHFLTAIFVSARWREIRATGSMHALTDFHASLKFLLYGRNETELRNMGRIAANPDKLPFDETARLYEVSLERAFAKPATPRATINAMQHAIGFCKSELSAPEKRHFAELLDGYRAGKLPLSAPVAVLRSYIVRFELEYLARQRFFAPYPPDLVEIRDSGKGRGE